MNDPIQFEAKNVECFDVVDSQCSCGTLVKIDRDANNGGVRRTCRSDGKRIFYADEKDTGWCIFRCRKCGKPISESCPEAAYDENNCEAHDEKWKNNFVAPIAREMKKRGVGCLVIVIRADGRASFKMKPNHHGQAARKEP